MLENRAIDWLRAFRVHQWSKNILIFAAAVGGHRVLDIPVVLLSLQAFFAFCLLASATYLLNDIVDLANDREHSKKSLRPLAAQKITVKQAYVAVAILLLGAGLILATLPLAVTGLSVLYLGLTLSYSLWLKRSLLLDVVALTLFFNLRLMVGSAATGIELSFWILAFAIFFFLGLAILKRYSDLLLGPDNSRAYAKADLPMLAILGVSANMVAILVLALFLDSATLAAKYSEPVYLWLTIPIMLYWSARMWILGGRGQIEGDPLVFALKERHSWICGIIVLVLMYLAI